MSLNAYARTAAIAQLALDLRMHFEDADLPDWLPAADTLDFHVTASGLPCASVVHSFFDLCRMWGISDDTALDLYEAARADLEAAL